MLHRFAFLLLLALPAASLAQTPAKSPVKKSAAARAKSMAGKIVDSAATGAASMATDTLLGDRAGAVASLVTGTPMTATPTCAAGQVLYPAPNQPGAAPTAGAAGMTGMPQMPSAGGLLVGAAKKKLAAKKADSAARAAAAVPAGPRYICGTPAEATASMDASQAQAQAPAAQPSAMGTAGSMLAATPQGMLVTGAIAAAPAATQGIKKLGGMFGRGKQNKESMVKDLAKGRLVVKALRFANGTDDLEAGFEAEIAVLAEALQAAEGQYLLNVPAESEGKSPVDTLLAQRRLARVAAHLQLAGITEARLAVRGVWPIGLDPKKDPPRRGETRVEVLRMPPESKP